MKLNVSYDLLYHNWYVGEFYRYFFEKLQSLSNIEVNFKPMHELAAFHNVARDYHNGFPSIFSPYNLIISNVENGKTFVHSWNDYAPAMLQPKSGIENLDVVKFACVSRLDEEFMTNYSGTIKVQPSVYLLENWNDHDLIVKNRSNQKTNPKLYFNGLCYGVRERYRHVLSKSNFFDFKKKDSPDYLDKSRYFEQLSNYKYGLNLDGAAKICYRDLEYFGMQTLLFREKLDVLTFNPLFTNEHYIELFDDEVKSIINNDEKIDYVIQLLENRINEEISNTEKVSYILNNSFNWFEQNCLPENQANIILSFFEDFTIFE